MLPRFDELVRDSLGMPVRIGTPTNLAGLSDAVDSPPFATGVGLVKWGMTHGLRHPGGLANTVRESGNWRNVYDRFKGWLKEFLP